MSVPEDLDDFFQTPTISDVDADESAEPKRRLVPPRLGLLTDLSVDEFDQVARAAKLGHTPAETVIFRQGDAADRFFILIEGNVQVERDGELLATLGPGAFFGESALLVRGRRSATITTLTDSSLWSVSYAAFDDAMSHHLLADHEAGAEASRRIAATPVGGFDGPDKGDDDEKLSQARRPDR